VTPVKGFGGGSPFSAPAGCLPDWPEAWGPGQATATSKAMAATPKGIEQRNDMAFLVQASCHTENRTACLSPPNRHDPPSLSAPQNRCVRKSVTTGAVTELRAYSFGLPKTMAALPYMPARSCPVGFGRSI